jgi:hypothetical protein
MYAPSYAKNGSLKHSDECTMHFGHKDLNCPRCAEMLAGAPSRSGWQKSYYSRKAQEEKSLRAAIAEHFAPGGEHDRIMARGGVDTAFEW